MFRSGFVLGAALLAAASGCSPMSENQEPVLAGVGTPNHITSDFSHVYVATDGPAGAKLHRVDKREWQQQPVCALPGPIDALKLASDHVYWLLDRKASGEPTVFVQKAEKKTGATVEPVLESRQRVTSFALDATHMYWTQTGPADHPDEAQSAGVLRAMDPTGVPTNVVTRLEGEPYRITLGGAHVYWVTKQPDGSSAVMSWAKMGGDPVELLMLHANELEGQLPHLAATDHGVYVLTRRELIEFGSDGAWSQQLRRGFIAHTDSLIFDFHHVYFRTQDGLTRMNPDASEPFPVAKAITGPFAVGADFVYWTKGQQVLRHEK